MKINSFVIMIFLFLFQSGFSQTQLKGKVISDASNLDGINVINFSAKKNTVTEKGGFFSILAKPTDTIMFSGIQVKGIQIVLALTDFSENLFFVKLKQQVNTLDEVYIKNYPEINAVSLGVVSKGTKSYTPAQRRLKTAGDFKPIHLLNLLGGSLPVDPILNAISGRTKMLKKEVEIENKERLFSKLSNFYEQSFFVETLKIPSEYVNGFKIFAIDDQRLVANMKSKNKTMITFLLGELSEKYKSNTFPKKE